MMAQIEHPIVIEGFGFVKCVIQRFVDEVEFTDDTSEEYKKGFYDFGKAVVEALDSMIVRKADDSNV